MEEIDETIGGTDPIMPPSQSDKVIAKLNKLASGQLTTGKVTDAVDTKVYNTDIGASKYDEGMIFEQHLDPKDMIKSVQEYRARKQPVADQIANAVVNVAGELTLGTIGQLASALDFEDYVNSDQEVGNWLTSITNAGQDALRENFKNYHKNPGEHFAVNDSAWWIDTIGGLVGSVGSFALSGGVIGKGLMGLSKLARAKKLADAMTKVVGKSPLDKLYKVTGGHRGAEIREQAFGTIGGAVMLNQAEGMIEASDVMEATYQYQMQKNPDMSEEEARAIAVRAGVTTLNTNRANIILNLTSANLFLKAGKYSNSMSSLANPSKLNSLKRGLQEGGQESLEEVINLWAGKRGTAVGKGQDYSMADAIDNLFSLEALEAATLGFIGGMGQTVATAEGVNRFMTMGDPENEGQKISIRDYNKRQYAKAKQHISDLNKAFQTSDIGTVTAAFKNQQDRLKLIQSIREAEENDDTGKAEQLKQMLLTVQAEDAFSKGVADHLIKLYEDLGNGPQKEGMGKDYKEKAQEAVETIKALQKLYDNHAHLEAGRAIYQNRAGRYTLTKGIKGAKEELALAQNELADEISRITDGTDLNIALDFKDIPETATKEEIAAYEKLKRTDAYGKVKDLEGTIVDLNREIDNLDDQYEVFKSPEIQEAFKKQRESMESGEVTKKEEEALEKEAEELEKEAEKQKEAKEQERKEKEEAEAVKAAEAAEAAKKEEEETEFDKAVKNYSVGEQIPITSTLVDGLNPDEEHGGTLIEVDEEAGTMLVELEDGTIVTVHRDRKVEFTKPEIHTTPEADFSTEGGSETKVAEPAPDTKNTTQSGEEGGAKIISRMDDGTPLLNRQGVAWMEEQFGEYLAYERMPMNKQGKRVGFEINQPFTDNQRRAVNIYNKKVKRKHKDPITEQELRTLYYHLPILAHFGGNVKAPIENETKEENRTQGDRSVENFENFTLPLRKGIIDALVAGKDISKIYTKVQDQYKGVLQVAPKTKDGKVAENNVMELDYIDGDFSKIDLWVVNDDHDLENKHGDKMAGGMAGKGEIYLLIKQANGEPYRLKLNVRRVNENESEVLYQLYKLRLLNQEVNKGTRLNKLPETERKIIMDLAKDAIKIMTSTGKSKNDLTVKDLTDFFIWDLSTNEKTQVRMDKDGFHFGQNTIHGKSIADNKEKFKTWLQENKRHHIKFKTKKNDTVTLNAKVEKYVKYLMESGIINTNAVVGEPTFQKRTHIYLEPKARVEGEEQATPDTVSKKKIEKSTMSKKGMTREEAVIAVDEMFKARIMEKKRSLISQGVKRHLAAKQASEFYADEIAKALEKMMGVSSEPAPVPPVKTVYTGKITEEVYKTFIDTGKVSEEIIDYIADKIARGKKLSEHENAIFTDKTGEINKKLKELKDKEKAKKEPTNVEGNTETTTETPQVDPTHPEIAALTQKLKEDLSTTEMAFRAGAISAENLEQEKQELNDNYTEAVKKIAEKIRKSKENVLSLKEQKKLEKKEKLKARRAKKDRRPPNKQC